jgi:acyl-coenzyme A thioesterase PaaI-like protein
MNDANLSLVKEIFQKAKFIRSLGIELISCGRGWCEPRVSVAPVLRQQHGFIHAGVLMTLADHTCGGAAASTAPEGRDVVTVENKVSFFASGFGAKSILWRRGVAGREESHLRRSDGDG